MSQIQVRCLSMDVTPSRHGPLFGRSIGRPSSPRRHGNLELNLLLIHVDEAVAILLVSGDLLYFGPSLVKRLSRYVRTRPGLSRCEVLCCASHTHFVPNVDESKPKLGIVDERFSESILTAARSGVDELLSQTARRVRLTFGEVTCHAGIDRRRKGWRVQLQYPYVTRDIVLLPNRSRSLNMPLQVLCGVDVDNDNPQFVLWSLACHPVSFFDPHVLTPDFPGLLRGSLREHLGLADLPVLFVQGFSGDIRPLNPFQSLPRTPQQWVHRVLNGDFFGDFHPEEYKRWLSSILTDLKFALRTSTVLSDVNIQFTKTRLPLSCFLQNDPGRFLEIYHLVFSRELGLLGFNAELVSAYRSQIQPVMPHRSTIYGGCINHVFGYVPTDQMISEGGYESRRFFEHFSLESTFQPHIQRKVVDAVKSTVS